MTHDANETFCQFVEMNEHDYEVNNGFYAPPDCQCVLIAKVRKETLDAAVQRVEALEYDPESGVDWNWDYDIDPTGMTRNPLVWIRVAVAAIKNEVK